MRVEQHIISKNHELYDYCDKICFQSKNLYNLANYYIRKEFINNKKWLRYNELYNLLKNTEDYKILMASSSQQILRQLDNNWGLFFIQTKDWSKNKNKYNNKPKLPKYKNKNGRNIVIFTNQQCPLKNEIVTLPYLKNKNIINMKARTQREKYARENNIKKSIIKTKVKNLQQVRIIPKSNCYVIEVVYKNEIQNLQLDKNNILGIDLGLNNLATCVNNQGLQSFVINGKIIKSFNQFYNKTLSHYKSLLPKNQYTSNRIQNLTLKRNNKIKDYMHKSSKYIIDYCIQNNIGIIVVGKNKDWKQNINLGKRNNQNFVSIPFNQLIQMIQYKAEEVGIQVILTEESYTSGCSFLDNEPLNKEFYNKSRRITRGLFRSNKNVLINADCNGAYNIIKKVFPNTFVNGIEGEDLVKSYVLHPFIINL